MHCFEYGRAHSKELEKLCEKVFYYPRKTGLLNNLSPLPYTVKSRVSDELVKNLLTNDFPILFEVLHTCYLLKDERFKKRFKIYRHSNIEHDYYRHLAVAENNILKKIYLNKEADRLERFEPIISNADLILAVSTKDLDYFKKKYPNVKSEYLPSFHPNNEINIKEGKGDYILYHGNLSISENYEAAFWLIKKVFNKINYPVKIAGLNPPDSLKTEIGKFKHIELIANPNEEQMNSLIDNAQIHTLYTEQATGLKLKLLNVLFKGRFVLCNNKMLAGTGLNANKSLFICNSPNEFIKTIELHFNLKFEKTLSTTREKQLENFSNEKNVERLISLVIKV